MLKLQSKVKELNREVRNKDEEVEDQRRAIDGLKQDKRKGDKSINEVSKFFLLANSISLFLYDLKGTIMYSSIYYCYCYSKNKF